MPGVRARAGIAQSSPHNMSGRCASGARGVCRRGTPFFATPFDADFLAGAFLAGDFLAGMIIYPSIECVAERDELRRW